MIIYDFEGHECVLGVFRRALEEGGECTAGGAHEAADWPPRVT